MRDASRRVRAALLVAALILAALVIHDVITPAGRGFAARTAIFAIDGYRARVSPRLSGVVTCRFTPTCSEYGRAVFAQYGFARGGLKTASRIARCGPWTPQGTIDPP